MAEFPALPLWTDAYLADTTHLTLEEHGIYMMLLITMWRAPHLRIPNDNKWIARRLGMGEDEVVEKVRPIIDEFCRNTGNWISQKRLDKEFKYLREQSARQRKRAQKRWQDADIEQHGVSDKPLKTNGRDPHSGNAPTPTPTPTPTKDKSPTGSNSSRDGDFVNGNGGGWMMPQLDESTIERARAAAPGFDVYALQRIHADWIHESGDPPRNYPNAFVGFCKRHAENNPL